VLFRSWHDGGDGIYSAGGGDDVELGPFAWVNGAWYSPILNAAVPSNGLRLFVGLTAAAIPTNGATIRLAAPVDGITLASDNDGPSDMEIVSLNTSMLSTAPLLAEIHFVEWSSTVGQTVTLRMRVRNVGSENLVDVTPGTLVPAGAGVLVPASGPVPASLDLAIGAVDSFSWTFTSSSPGDIIFAGDATGTGVVVPQPHSSVSVNSDLHSVVNRTDRLDLFTVDTMPFSIVRGQVDIVPMTLTFINPGVVDQSDALLHSIRISLKDDTGLGIVPADLLSRVVINEGGNTYIEKSVLETTGDQIDLFFTQPIPVTSLEPVTLGLKLDVLPTASVSAFMVEIENATWFDADDSINGTPVPVSLDSGTFPIQSGLGAILAEATELQVSSTSSETRLVGIGQENVSMMSVVLTNPANVGVGSSIRVGSFAISLTDTLGVPIAKPSQILHNLRITSPLQSLLEIEVVSHDNTVILLHLSSPLTVPMNTPLELSISADIADPAQLGAVQLRLADASSFLAFDGNSGALVPVTYGTDPVVGNSIIVQQPASRIIAADTPLLPSELVVGAPDVPALVITLHHPGLPSESDILVESLTVQSRNGSGQLFSPVATIDKLVFLRNGIEVGSISNPTGDGNMLIPLAGLQLQPGQTETLTLMLDVEATAPSGLLELLVQDYGVIASEQTLGLTVAAQPGIGEEFPLTSGITLLQDSADEFRIGFTSLMPTVLGPSSSEIPVAKIDLRVPNQGGTAGLDLVSLAIRAADDQREFLLAGAALTEILAYNGDELWATTGNMAPGDSLGILAPLTTTMIMPGEILSLELRALFRSPSTVKTLVLGLDQGDVTATQQDGVTGLVRVEPESGNVFPYWTKSGAFTSASLAGSYSNFPNPFGAGREGTTFVFSLSQPATVSLKLLTGHNRQVVTLIDSEQRGPGLYQDDVWDGRNGRGTVVQNGVYIADLVVVYADGTKERVRRKVAVVR